jgi:hypothetical protein
MVTESYEMDEIETMLRKWRNKIKGNDVEVLLSAWRGKG